MHAKALVLAMSFGLAATVSAQSIGSFQLADIQDVSASLVGNQLTLNVGNNPTIDFMNQVYTVTEVFGVWSLDDDDDMTATGGTENGWQFSSNFSGTGGIAGWRTNPNSGLGPNASLVFNYTTLTGTVEDFGYHIRVDGTLPGGGNTAFFRMVPEPATFAGLGLGVLALLRRRRKVQ